MRTARATISLVLLALALAARAASGQQALLTKDAKRECATCHLDWVDSFERPGAVLLVDRPTKPQAAVEASCLGCHDGAVGDSRRGVWLEHGHRVNEAPTDKIKVPAHMPLEDGKMVCRTCHTAHTVPGANDLAKIVFLRSAKEGGLCQQCHVDRAYGAEHGSHPLAKLPFELPAELHEAHARTDMADRTKMACQTCHTTHGALQDHLLVMGTASGRLCVSCHEKLRPMEWKPDAPREHPQNPPLKNESQKRAIADMGTRLGPGDTLTCFSCHKMHASGTGKQMLADTLAEGRLCVRCHEDRKPVIASSHDLRKTKPLEKNRLGQTAEESGPCGACHSFHRYARDPAPGLGDPDGRCATCHASSGEHALPFAHPAELPTAKLPAGASKLALRPGAADGSTKALSCNTCHDPHDTARPRFLRATQDALCTSCHDKPAASLAGKHDFISRPELKNARGQTAAEAGKCGFCHGVHAPAGRVMWAATKQNPTGPDDLCTGCHRADGLAANTPGSKYNHPTGPGARPTTRPVGGEVVLFNDKGSIAADGFVSCASCHDPHADSDRQKAMLRVGGASSELCGRCHTQNAAMAGGPHDPRGKKEFPLEAPAADLCTACHRPHADDPVKQRYTFVPAAGLARADGACVACHAKQTWEPPGKGAPVLGRSMHPTTVPASHATLSAGLPLLKGEDGGAAIACKTCHDPHARPGTPGLTRLASGGAAQTSAASLCVRCHTEAEPLARGMHAADAFAARGQPSDRACAPCHSTHAVEGSQRQFLWAAKNPGWDLRNPDERCLSCHNSEIRKGGRRLVIQHPPGPVKMIPWTTTRPVAAAAPATPGAAANVAANAGAEIHCATCHETHGEASAPHEANLDARRAGRPMIRPDVASSCAHCHGADAPRMVLYWHNPLKRGPVRMGGTGK